MLKRALSLILIAGAVFSVHTHIAFCQNIYVPMFDPVNEDISRLKSRGYLNDIVQSERPWAVNDVIRAMVNERERFDSESELIAVSILERLEPHQKIIPRRMFGDFNAGIELRGNSRERKEGYFIERGRYFYRGFKGEFGSVYRSGWWLSKDGSWGVDARLIFDSDGTGFPWYYGTAHNARTIGQFDHAYINFEISRFDILLGRQRLQWGPSPRGSLILDGTGPPLDQVGASFNLKPFRLSWFVSRLDDNLDLSSGRNINRYLSGHRLSFVSSGKFEIAASEIVLYGGYNRLPELYYGIPIVLYYWEAQNRKVDDNILWALDLSYIFDDIGRAYMQFAADDIQYESNGPQKWAVQAGANVVPSKFPLWSGLFEINFVDTYVYGQRIRHNAYLHWGKPIGRLDSDQMELFAGLYRKMRKDLRLGLEYIYREKGEYSADIQYSDPLPENVDFPSGTAERMHDIRFDLRWSRFNNIYMKCIAGYQDIENFANIENNSNSQFYSMLVISFSFDSGLPFWTKYQ